MAAPVPLDKEVRIIAKGSSDSAIRKHITTEIFWENGYKPEMGKDERFEEQVKMAAGSIESLTGTCDVTLKVVGTNDLVRSLKVYREGKKFTCIPF